jgi:hypothetical protein
MMTRSLPAILLAAALAGCNTVPKAPVVPQTQLHFKTDGIDSKACDHESGCYLVIRIKEVSGERGPVADPAPCVYRQVEGASELELRDHFWNEVGFVDYAKLRDNYLSTHVKARAGTNGTSAVRGTLGCYDAIMSSYLWPSVALDKVK